ncbi:cold shock domain-containing protein [Flavobacterium sp. xlx-214]|uniref:cold shock domain-containing protein n=1 Tax=unclassified Flavobacterium TaxID=196869 RepID=UPI0013D69564|nr:MULTISPECIES: cold shock domain-containing protein [unclassified Flavobacterium]MBA5791549.1 cold shock domain-containing protein [Flavobacterium sp. xlx-221]QMI82802.1 cold shock domain-containing protein [Flavobacterium sp. xlx-214]
MADSFTKKENNKKKTKRLQDKQLRRDDRKDNNNKGKTLDDMIVYVDVNGHFTEVPPHMQNRDADLARAIKAQQTSADPDADFTGIVNYMSEKGFGFITEDETGENVFFHVGQTTQTVEKHNKVTYKKELTPKGYQAVEVKK